nr:class I SAM-dependent methyltransferase [Metabacillus lacus]
MLSSFGVSGAHPGGFALTKAIIEKAGIQKNRHILDAGCGTGQTLEYLLQNGYSAVGADVDSVMIEKAAARLQPEFPKTKLYHCSIEASLLPDSSFDIVLSESVLNFTNLSLSLPECFRILRNTGILLSIEPVIEKILSPKTVKKLLSFYGFQQLFTTEEWRKHFRDAGFQNVQIMNDDDYIYNREDSISEFLADAVVPEQYYKVLSDHQKLTVKHKGDLGYRIFMCEKFPCS